MTHYDTPFHENPTGLRALAASLSTRVAIEDFSVPVQEAADREALRAAASLRDFADMLDEDGVVPSEGLIAIAESTAGTLASRGNDDPEALFAGTMLQSFALEMKARLEATETPGPKF